MTPPTISNLDDWPMARPGEAPMLDNANPLPPPTGWQLVIGRDANGAAVAFMPHLIVPPGLIRRVLIRLLTGWRWERTAIEGVARHRIEPAT